MNAGARLATIARCRAGVRSSGRGAAASTRALVHIRATGANGVVDDRVLADLDPAVAVALRLARDEGAPLAAVLDAATAAADRERRIAADVAAAVAPARTVARSLVALPLVAVPVLGTLAGTDLVGFYLRDPLGHVVGAIVVVLLVVAMAWMRVILADDGATAGSGAGLVVVGLVVAVTGPTAVGALVVVAGLVARARPRPTPPSPHLAVVAELAAVGLAAGHGLSGALRLAADHLPAAVDGDPAALAVVAEVRTLALDLVLRPDRGATTHGTATAAVVHDRIGPLAEAAGALATTGAPGVDVLRGLADRLRDDRARRARTAAARLPARLTFPTALLLVPATVLAIGAPIVLQGLAGITGT